MIGLEELLSYEIGEVLKSPQLKGAVTRYCSILYFGGAPVNSCESSIRNHFRHLILDGLSTQKRLSNMKYQLKPEIGYIIFDNQKYNSSEMTDEIAEKYLEKFPKAIGNFKVNEDAPAAEPEKPKVSRGPKPKK